MRRPLVTYDFATDPIRISLHMRTILLLFFISVICTLYPPGVLGAGDRGEGNDGGVQGVHRQVVILGLHLPTPLTK
jgi:hypothetical protein